MGKKDMTGKIRYVKVGDSSVYRYFTEESIRLYKPERSGWVREDSPDVPAPTDVVNFMGAKPVEVKTCNKDCNPVDVTTQLLKDRVAELEKALDDKKEEPKPAEKPVELRDFSTVATRKLQEMLAEDNTITDEELLNIVKTDTRVTAKKIATDEIQKREKA